MILSPVINLARLYFFMSIFGHAIIQICFMGIVVMSNAIGIDQSISKIQERLYGWLTTTGGWDASQYQSYHRAYKNNSRNGVIPEAFTEKSTAQNEYQEVLLNDNLDSNSFFIVGDDIPTNEGMHIVPLSVIYQINLDSVYGTESFRVDEPARNDVIVGLQQCPLVGELGIKSVVTGVENVYREFNTEKLELDNMHPFHVFRIDMEITVDYNCGYIACLKESTGQTGFSYILDFKFGK